MSSVLWHRCQPRPRKLLLLHNYGGEACWGSGERLIRRSIYQYDQFSGNSFDSFSWNWSHSSHSLKRRIIRHIDPSQGGSSERLILSEKHDERGRGVAALTQTHRPRERPSSTSYPPSPPPSWPTVMNMKTFYYFFGNFLYKLTLHDFIFPALSGLTQRNTGPLQRSQKVAETCARYFTFSFLSKFHMMGMRWSLFRPL